MGGGPGKNGYIYILWLGAFTVHETITTLLTGYTPIQNKKFKVWAGGAELLMYLRFSLGRRGRGGTTHVSEVLSWAGTTHVSEVLS